LQPLPVLRRLFTDLPLPREAAPRSLDEPHLPVQGLDRRLLAVELLELVADELREVEAILLDERVDFHGEPDADGLDHLAVPINVHPGPLHRLFDSWYGTNRYGTVP